MAKLIANFMWDNLNKCEIIFNQHKLSQIYSLGTVS